MDRPKLGISSCCPCILLFNLTQPSIPCLPLTPSPQQQDVNQLSAQLDQSISLTPTQNNTQLAMLPEGSYEGVSPSNQPVGVSKPTSEALVTTAQVIHKVQSKGQSPVLSHGHTPSPTHFQMPGPYIVGVPYPNHGGVQFVATGNQYQQQNVQQHPMIPIPVSTQLPSGESPLPTATVPSPYLYQQVPASPLQQVASNQSFFPGVASMQQQGPPLFSPPGTVSGCSVCTLGECCIFLGVTTSVCVCVSVTTQVRVEGVGSCHSPVDSFPHPPQWWLPAYRTTRLVTLITLLLRWPAHTVVGLWREAGRGRGKGRTTSWDQCTMLKRSPHGFNTNSSSTTSSSTGEVE